MPANSTVEIERRPYGGISVTGGCSHPFGPVPDVWNTSQIRITGGAGSQTVGISLENGGFKPGKDAEVGTSDEIEFTVLLGDGDDSLILTGTNAIDTIRLGDLAQFPASTPAINMNGTDADADLRYLSVEHVEVHGYGGADVLSAAGGIGFDFPLGSSVKLAGGNGNDTVTGGSAGDELHGGPGSDDFVGGKGNDWLYGLDNISGNDSLNGAGGTADECISDAGDAESGCEL